SQDYINLTFNAQDWLDKPHLQFIITALFYKYLGVHVYSYILPGFLFNLLGARYTYLLAKKMYQSKEVGLFASLFYLTSVHLMLSSIDVRQEAFLLGEIMPACYYWFLYQEDGGSNKMHNLLLGAFFSALAVMTKGIFVLILIFSGVFFKYLYAKKLRQFFCIKWLLALILIFIFILPELFALYWQFDMHPEKLVFGRYGVSGLKFFFIDSQFGRFFNNGPISVNNNGALAHYFYYIHTLLCAVLPWTPLFLIALWNVATTFRISTDIPENKQVKLNYVYLLGSIIPILILFSLTRFQLDHYTNIIIPFICILCADWIYNKATRLNQHFVLYIEIFLSFILVIAVFILTVLILTGMAFYLSFGASAIVVIALVVLNNNYNLTKAVVYPVLAILLVFVFCMLVNGTIYGRYDIGYQITRDINIQKNIPIVDYKINSSSLEFNAKNTYLRIDNEPNLLSVRRPFYLVVSRDNWNQLKDYFLGAEVIKKSAWIREEKFIPTLINKNNKKNNIIDVYTVKIQ
ncbi:MAG: hypothetical protein E6Q89_06180, partial [Bacteroidia bacterium]